MKPRLLTLLFTTTLALPVFAQQKTGAQQQTPAQQQASTAVFLQQKLRIDSLIQVADTIETLQRAAFNGKARIGRYRVECYYNTPSKEILKANFLFITDSLNFSKVFYFKENNLIKVSENDTTIYYQVGDRLLNEQGTAAAPAVSKSLMSVITDTFQGLYAALFQ